MGEISTELKTFKSTVEPKIGDMNSTCSKIQSDIQKLSTSATNAKSSIGNCYNSENKTTILSKLDQVGSIYSKISASVGSDLKGMIDSAESLVNEIKALEVLNDEIAALRTKLNSMKNETDYEKQQRSNVSGQITQKETEFTEKHEKAKSNLQSLKGRDASISFTSEFAPGKADAEIDNLEYGKIEEIDFESKDGIKIHTYVYIPKSSGNEVVKGLPVMLYMHGDSTNNGDTTQAISHGLPKLISDGKVTPQGIVIMPYLPGAGASFDGEKNQKALIELTNYIVDKYDADTDRISVSGHSHGAMTAYKLVNNNPGYFSCCVPISGTAAVGDEFKNVPVWSFNSTNEGNNSSGVLYNAGVNAVNKINSIGGNAKLTSLKKNHKNTCEEAYEQEYDSPDGKKESALEWAFRQEKA